MLESDGADRPWEGESDGSELGVGVGLGRASSGWTPRTGVSTSESSEALQWKERY